MGRRCLRGHRRGKMLIFASALFGEEKRIIVRRYVNIGSLEDTARGTGRFLSRD